MLSVIALFDADLADYISLEEVVGLKPLAIGYTTLVFKFSYRNPSSAEPIKQYLLWWFKTKLHGEVGSYSSNEAEEQVWWVKVAVEIKEDRGGNYSTDPDRHGHRQ